MTEEEFRRLVTETIRVYYSCPQCKLVQVHVDVPVRETEEQDVRDWFEGMLERLRVDHFNRNPHCPTTQLIDIRVPMKGRAHVGGPKQH